MTGPIVVNGRATVRGRISGVERVAREVISRLIRLRPDHYTILSPRRGSGRAAGQAWEQVVLPLNARRLGAALIYSPANLAPLIGPPRVVVLHDAAVWRQPDAYSHAYTVWHQRVGSLAARRALKVLTPSEFSRQELVEVLGLNPDSVAVVPNGVDGRFAPSADPEPARRAHGLTRPYVLTVGSADRRKNLQLLRRVAERLEPDGIDAVWAGGEHTHMPAGGAGAGVHALGYVADHDLPGLYAGALAFVLPSRYEGFGITCLEAMACGTPVVAADRAALPETCAGAALLVDPDDEEAFADAVEAVVGDPARRAKLRETGLARAAQLSWDNAARQTDTLLVELARALA